MGVTNGMGDDGAVTHSPDQLPAQHADGFLWERPVRRRPRGRDVRAVGLTHFDWRLALDDLARSPTRPPCSAPGCSTRPTTKRMVEALGELRSDVAAGRVGPGIDEDVHGALERLLIERVGPNSAAGCGRVDPATTRSIKALVRRWLRREIRLVALDVLTVVGALRDQAERHLG